MFEQMLAYHKLDVQNRCNSPLIVVDDTRAEVLVICFARFLFWYFIFLQKFNAGNILAGSANII